MADAAATDAFAHLVDLMARLRAPGGCPWDREQTAESLRPYVLEEAYEVLDAIGRGDVPGLRDELGDLLLQVVFQAEIASETGQFTIADVARAITDKLTRRHPHVFGDVTVTGAADVVRNWQEIKAAERRAAGRRASVLDGIPTALPALARAQQLADRLAAVGFDWPDLGGVLRKLDEERAELAEALASGDRDAAAHELGDVLLTLASAARHAGLHAETVLRDATERLVRRADWAERAAEAQGRRLADLSGEERDRLWDEAKARV